MEGRSISGTIDNITDGAADGREASGMLNPAAARMYGIAPEPSIIGMKNGLPVYDNSLSSDAAIPAQQTYQSSRLYL